MARFNINEFNRKLREAQRKAQQEMKREVDRINRVNKKAVDDYNRKARAHNMKVIDDYNTRARVHNRKADAQNKRVIADINRQLRTATSGARYTPPERELADRVYRAVGMLDPREYDTFLSYARIDGAGVAAALKDALEDLGVAVWYDEVAIIP